MNNNRENTATLKIEITIPVYNEESSLKEKVIELYNYLSCFIEYEIIIVIADNGSTDNTQAIGEQLSADFPTIKYLAVGQKGVGLALKQSWSRSDADIIACMDLDLSTDVNHIPEAIRYLVNHAYDIVYASRLATKSRVIGRGLKREISSRSFNFIIRNYLGVKISDAMCGFIFLKRSYFDILVKGTKNDKWFFQAEILVVSEWLNLKMKELPVVWKDDPNSKVKVVPLAIEYLKAMYSLRKLKHSIINDTGI